MTKEQRHYHNEQCLRACQREQGKEGDALPFAKDWQNPPAPAKYWCIVRHEPAGPNQWWVSELECTWDGEKWERCDGGRLRHGIISWSEKPTV